MTPTDPDPQVQGPNLTIGVLAEQTGLTPAVLRMWESRHGFPTPHRLASGHRRYTSRDVELVRQVVRRRDAGTRLDVAIADARGSATTPGSSVFAELRRRHPAQGPHRLRKSTLIALSWALEDECCARAERPVLVGAFQEERFYRPSAPRWRELARVARTTLVMGHFEAPDEFPRGGPVPVPLPDDSPMRREWVVVCDSPDLSACLTAWEIPGQLSTPDRDRVFEALWTVDPRAVRDATRVCAQVAQAAGVAEARALLDELSGEPPAEAVDVAAATTLMNRMVAYVDRLVRH